MLVHWSQVTHANMVELADQMEIVTSAAALSDTQDTPVRPTLMIVMALNVKTMEHVQTELALTHVYVFWDTMAISARPILMTVPVAHVRIVEPVWMESTLSPVSVQMD